MAMAMERPAATGLSRCGERVRAAAAAADVHPGQGRGDSGAGCWRRFGADKVLGGLTHEYYAAA
jgi:hypothetical protein